MRAYQLVSKPLGEHARTGILPGGQPLTDTRRLFSGVRRHADGRIHVSADGPVFDMSGEPKGATLPAGRLTSPRVEVIMRRQTEPMRSRRRHQ